MNEPGSRPSLATCLGLDLAMAGCLFIALQAMFHFRLALSKKGTEIADSV